MFVIKASTPEAMRDEIVKWLNQQASNHRIAASKLKGMHATTVELAKAQTYEGAANFLKNCSVNDTRQQNWTCRAPSNPVCTVQCKTCASMEETGPE